MLAVRRSLLALVVACSAVLFIGMVAMGIGPAEARSSRSQPATQAASLGARLATDQLSTAGALLQPPPTSAPVDTADRTVETTPQEKATAPTTTAPRNRLIPIPAGCPRPNEPAVVFVGVVVDSDATTARFRLQQVRAGSADRYARGRLVDIEYGIDTKYLQEGGQYLVGADVSSGAGVLASKVRSEQPLFGGNDVVGVAESDVDCPVVEDSIRTLTVTGRSIESGVLEPLKNARGDMLRALVVPVIVAFGIVLGLATLRWILTGMAHGASTAIGNSRERHRQDDDDAFHR